MTSGDVISGDATSGDVISGDATSGTTSNDKWMVILYYSYNIGDLMFNILDL
jgi:hypothetical protein